MFKDKTWHRGGAGEARVRHQGSVFAAGGDVRVRHHGVQHFGCYLLLVGHPLKLSLVRRGPREVGNGPPDEWILLVLRVQVGPTSKQDLVGGVALEQRNHLLALDGVAWARLRILLEDRLALRHNQLEDR